MRTSQLAKSFGNKTFRHAFMARQLKLFLAEQIRALRGDLTQKQFGDKIGKPQSVVSRLEKQFDRQISVQTLIDIAGKLDIAVIIRFLDFSTFLRYTEDYSDAALVPRAYDQAPIDRLASSAEHTAQITQSLEKLPAELRSVELPKQPAELREPLGPKAPDKPQKSIEQAPVVSDDESPLMSQNVVPFRQIQQRSYTKEIQDVGQPPAAA
jgi:transcriptional regulator with XRE-family HTH domain